MSKIGWKERGFALATKIQYPYNHGDNSGDKVKESMKTSLADLGTNSVDVIVYPPTYPTRIAFITASCGIIMQ